jgi:hypothetical protein
MDKGGYSQSEGELGEETFATGRHMTDEDPSLATIKSSKSSLNQLPHLQNSSPHSALSPCNRRLPLSIIKQFMHDNSPSKPQQPQLQSANLQKPGIMFIDDKEIVHDVLLCTEFLENADIFAGAPGCVDGDIECGGLCEEEGEF